MELPPATSPGWVLSFPLPAPVEQPCHPLSPSGTWVHVWEAQGCLVASQNGAQQWLTALCHIRQVTSTPDPVPSAPLHEFANTLGDCSPPWERETTGLTSLPPAGEWSLVADRETQASGFCTKASKRGEGPCPTRIPMPNGV